MKRILINATQAEELRVAMVNGQRLYDLDIEVPSREQKKSNIYKGKITRIEPSLEAAFINYGAERHGFLPFKEIAKQYYGDVPRDDKGKPILKNALKVDQEIIVQVEKEERGNKGAALTSFISLAGRFLVAMPQNPRAGGVSRRIEGDERDDLKRVLGDLKMPEGMGVIVRTAGVGRSSEEMQWDLDYLTQVWQAIEKAADEKKAPFLIYQESNIVIRALRDHYRNDIGEILIDSEKAYQQAHEFMSMVMPGSLPKLKRFEDKLPLFHRFQVENQIESAFSREVGLSAGGAIVIDHTEALTSIDVNSARATKGSDIEDTAKMTNLEAADEIARQLRIRDLGGLIVIDFIDMMQNKNQREVETRLRNAVYDDRARVQIGRISRFGLLEMSRQRLRPSLEESSQIVCPRCSGQGAIRDVESLSLAVLRLVEDEALKDNTGKILAKVPVECATYLLNEKRDKVDAIEQRRQVHVVIIPDPRLETPHYEIERVKDNDTHRHESNYKKSYEMTSEEPPVNHLEMASSTPVNPEKAAVQRIAPPPPKPAPAQPGPPSDSEGGFLSKLLNIFGAGAPKKTETAADEEDKPSKNQSRGGNRNRRRGRGGQNRSRGTASAKPQDANKRAKSQEKDSRATDNTEKAESSENRRSGQSRSGRSRGGNRGGNRGGRSRQAESQKSGDSTGQPRAGNQDAQQDNAGNQSRQKNAESESRPKTARKSTRRGNGKSAKPSREEQSGQTEARTDTASNADSVRARQADKRADSQADNKADSNPNQKAENKPDSKADKKVESKPDNALDSRSDSRPEGNPDHKPRSDSKPDGNPDANPDHKPRSGTGPAAKSEPVANASQTNPVAAAKTPAETPANQD